MKNCLLLDTLLVGFTSVVMVQSVIADMPNGYKVVVAPNSVSVATVSQAIYMALAPAPTYHPHPYVRHLASVGEGMIIEHQVGDRHH